MKSITWPAWFNGPNGQTGIFEAAEDVPNGWTSGAEKLTVEGKAPVKTESKPAIPPAKPAAKKAGRPKKTAALDL